MLTALLVVPPLTEPVKLRATVSFSVKAPPRVTAPRLAMTLAWFSVIALAVLALSVPVWTFVVATCVTAPVMSAPTPSVTVPAAPVVTLPSTTLLALRSVIAAAEALVVASGLLLISVIAAPPPSTAIVPLPASTLPAPLKTTPPLPPPVRLTDPLFVVNAWATVRPVAPLSAIAPPVVDNAPAVIIVALEPAIRLVMAPSVGVASDRLEVVFSATLAPVARSVTTPVRSLFGDCRLIEPAPASTRVVPPAATLPVVWLTPRPLSVTLPALAVAVMFWLPRASAPAEVMLTAVPAASPTAPVKVRPTLSFNVKAPPRVTAPRLAITLT